MSLMLSLHVAFLLIWCAGLLYFPQLLVRQADDDTEAQRSAIHMQRALYALIMTPSALLAVAAGTWMIFERGFSGGWLQVKLALVLLLVFFHAWCGTLMAGFRHAHVGRRLSSWRWLSLLPLLLICAILTLVTWKPF